MDAGDKKFQLGVSRAIPNSTSSGKIESSSPNGHIYPSTAVVNNRDNSNKNTKGEDSVLLRPTEDAISWSGSSSSSDILF